jgi:hypothetical protein
VTDIQTRARRATVLAAVFDVAAFMLAGSVLAELFFGAPATPQLRYAAAIVVVVASLGRVWVR